MNRESLYGACQTDETLELSNGFHIVWAGSVTTLSCAKWAMTITGVNRVSSRVAQAKIPTKQHPSDSDAEGLVGGVVEVSCIHPTQTCGRRLPTCRTLRWSFLHPAPTYRAGSGMVNWLSMTMKRRDDDQLFFTEEETYLEHKELYRDRNRE